MTKPYNDIPVIGYLCKYHLNDSLGAIVFCAYTNIVLLLFKRNTLHKLKQIIVYTLLCGVCWEYIFPYIFSYSTSDFWDIVSYVVGGILYYFLTLLLSRRGTLSKRRQKE